MVENHSRRKTVESKYKCSQKLNIIFSRLENQIHFFPKIYGRPDWLNNQISHQQNDSSHKIIILFSIILSDEFESDYLTKK
jgi:hypothetical protein